MTRTGEYALRALIYLAQHSDQWPIPGGEIARGAKVPAKYLQKILGDLTRSGVLVASPGRTGGFRLRRPAASTSLLDVLGPFERFQLRHCPFGNAVCSDRNPCGAHERWKAVVEVEQRFLRETTVADVAQSAQSNRGSRAR
jgi:Rrf2 family protein